MRWAHPWLQFNLRTLFAAVTLCAIGTWYWYQRPYPVETWVSWLSDGCFVGAKSTGPRPPKDHRQVQYYRRVRGKEPIRHGPYNVYDAKGRLFHSGYYRNGLPDGQFVDYWPDGGKRTWRMVRGSIQGQQQWWNGRGQLLEFREYVRGKLQGMSREWDNNGNLLSEENYDTGIQHGPYFKRDVITLVTVSGSFEQGHPNGAWKWSLDNSDIQQITGTWHEGQPDGRWEWTDRSGRLKLAADFKAGAVVRVEPNSFGPHVIEHVVRNSRRSPVTLASLFLRVADSDTLELSLEDLIGRVCSGYLGAIPDLAGLKLATLDNGRQVVLKPAGTSWLFALNDELTPHGLGYDLRYGALRIDTLEEIAAWQDATGVLSIIPSARSPLHEEWSSATVIDVVEMPLRDVFLYLSETHMVSIDASRLPETAVTGEMGTTLDTPVTINVQSVSFRDGLGLLLKQLELRAWLVGETIVIGPRQ